MTKHLLLLYTCAYWCVLAYCCTYNTVFTVCNGVQWNSSCITINVIIVNSVCESISLKKSERARKLPCLSPYDYAHYVHYDYWLWLSSWWCTHAHCHLMQNHNLLSLIMRWWIFSWIACIIRSMLGSRWLTTTVDINQAKNEKWKERRRRKQIMYSYVQTCV